MSNTIPPVELREVGAGVGGFVIHGEEAFDYLVNVASLGDVNGDGIDDVVIGATGADGTGDAESFAGAAYVVFGRSGGFDAPIDLVDVAQGVGGFVIQGEDPQDRAGMSVAAAGDMNGDGLADIAVGAPNADGASAGTALAGRAYVVFGSASGFAPVVELATVALGIGGFVMRGDDAFDRAATFLAAGDINGDGLDDLVVGADEADGPGEARLSAGAAYVVFGRTSGFGAPIDFADVAQGTGGFVIHGEEAEDDAGISVSAAGDFNGDGIADLVVGAQGVDGDGDGRDDAGAAYVVFGRAGGFGAAVDLADVALGQGGFVIHGEDEGDYAGYSVSYAGDVNGDGFDDLIIGAYGADGPDDTTSYAGAAYVVFGRAGDGGGAIGLAAVAEGEGGFVIHGEDADDYAGYSVSGAGDVNGDGFDDLLIGAKYADGADDGASYAGGAYVIFGKPTGFGAALSLREIAAGQGGFVIHGEDVDDYAGYSVAAAGDVNGDGFDDLMVGGWGADGPGEARSEAGAAYIVFGRAIGQVPPPPPPVPEPEPEPPVPEKPAPPTGPTFTIMAGNETAQPLAGAYAGPVPDLAFQFLGTARGEVVLGTAFNDFINPGAGDDAVDGGTGNDVIDGGVGSNFLVGGAGQDTFFIDGRGAGVSNSPTWSTVADWQAGEQVALFGWRAGVSQSRWVEQDGAAGYQGVTMHADLDADGTTDTSITWAGVGRAALPPPLGFPDLLWFV